MLFIVLFFIYLILTPPLKSALNSTDLSKYVWTKKKCSKIRPPESTLRSTRLIDLPIRTELSPASSWTLVLLPSNTLPHSNCPDTAPEPASDPVPCEMPQAHQKGIPIRENSDDILLTAAEKFDSWIGTVFHNFCGKFPQIGDWLTLYLYWCRNLISKTRKALPNSAKILATTTNTCIHLRRPDFDSPGSSNKISNCACPLYRAAASNNAQPETVCRHQNVAPWVYHCWPKRTLHTWHPKHPTVTAPLLLCYSPDLRVDVRWRDIVSGKCMFALQAFRLSRERTLDLAFRVLQPYTGLNHDLHVLDTKSNTSSGYFVMCRRVSRMARGAFPEWLAAPWTAASRRIALL